MALVKESELKKPEKADGRNRMEDSSFIEVEKYFNAMNGGATVLY